MYDGQDDTEKTSAMNDSIGIIMLDTQFPRFKGDVGNPDTWPFDVVLRTVKGASARNVVGATQEQNLQPFIDAAVHLQNAGVSGITTSCGFLSLAQAQIAEHLTVPFVASSLVQVPWVQSIMPAGKRVGILTINADALTTAHLLAAGISDSVPVKGTEHGQEFTRCVLGDQPVMDQSLCQQDNVNAAIQFVNEHPDLGAIVMECTNMAPYAHAVQKATRLPVYSIYTLIRWFQAGLTPAVHHAELTTGTT